MTLLTLFQGPSTMTVPPPIPNPGPTPGTPLLEIIQNVCLTVGVALPTTVFGSLQANRTMQEMIKLANEMARRIAYDNREWTKLRKEQVYYGDGTTTAFYLPSDYKRMLLTSSVWGANTQTPMRFVPDTDEWLQRRAAGDADSSGEWTMLGGQMHIHPALAYGATARYAYLDKNCIVRASDGIFTDRFWSDTDYYRLDSRLLELGMIWQWKAQKGAPYAEDMGTWGDALALMFAADSPAPIIVGRLPISANARVAYPWPAPSGYIT